MSPTSRRHHQRICGCNKPLLRLPQLPVPEQVQNGAPSICPDILDIIIDFLHDDKHTLGTCALVCKSWLPASRFHLFYSTTIYSHNAVAFRRLMCCRHSTLPSSIVHFKVWSRFWTPPVNFIPHTRTLRSLTLTCHLQHNTLPRSMDGFKSITVLNIMFVRIPTCGTLLDILAATPLLETATLSEIYWRCPGNIPDPQSFPYLHTLSMHCAPSSHILDWLFTKPLPALSSVSIRADSSIAGCQFLRTAGSSLQHLQVKKMFTDKYSHHPRNQADEIMFFNSVNLSINTNLRSITIDTLSAGYQVDVCFLPLISMLFRTNLPCLDTISFTLIANPYFGAFNTVPWTQLAQSVTALSNSLRSLNIILPGISPGQYPPSAYRQDRIRKMESWEQEIIGKLSGVRFGEKPLLAITNISFPPRLSIDPTPSSNRWN